MAERLDVYLVSKGLARSRERAKQMIKNGSVNVNGKTVFKPSLLIETTDEVTASENLGYVGRGALKLIKAFEVFRISCEGSVCADIGASTGGFTQVMLEHGAEKIYAVDVGSGQLDPMLSADSRVVDLENTNVKDLTPAVLGQAVSFMSVDLSFISLTKVLDVLVSLLCNGGDMVILIKPQFEAGRNAVGKNGIVKDRSEHIKVLLNVSAFAESCGLSIKGMTYSPVTGGSGNIEYLAWLKKEDTGSVPVDIRQLVSEAFSKLREKKK